MSFNRHARGFSLVEIMIVVVIIGLLASVVTLSVNRYMDRGRVNKAKADIGVIQSALNGYYAENGRYPTNQEGLQILVPEFIQKLSKDPWGKAYVYVSPGKKGDFEVVSYGSDVATSTEAAHPDRRGAPCRPCNGHGPAGCDPAAPTSASRSSRSSS
jgi:general secretion pathway protein G